MLPTFCLHRMFGRNDLLSLNLRWLGWRTNASTAVEFSLYEFGPCSGALETTQTGSGSSGVPSTTALATSFRDLVFVAYYAQSGSSNSTAGSGYTIGVNSTSVTVVCTVVAIAEALVM